MNLSDMLGYADIQQLSRIAGVYQCDCNGNSKNELIQSILSTVSRKDIVEQQINSMTLEDLRFLNSLLFDTTESFSLEDLIARVQQSRFGEESSPKPIEVKPVKSRKKKENAKAPPSPRDTIVRFKHQGWLFNGYNGPDRYLFQVPNDLKQRFREALQRKFKEQMQYTDEPPVYRDEQSLMQEDITVLLKYIRHHDIQLAADGAMYKRNVMQLLDLLGVQEQLPGKGEWRFGYGRSFNQYPNRLSLLYDYCYSAGFINEQDATLSLTSLGEQRLTGFLVQEAEQIYRFWLKQYKGPVVQLHAIVNWIESLAHQWVTITSLSEVLVSLIKPFYYDGSKTILEKRIIVMMLHLGLLRIGEHPLYGTVIRMTKAGHAIVSGAGLGRSDERIILH